MATVTLKHEDINGGVAVRVLCDSITLGGIKNIVSKSNANIDGPVEVQTQSFENPVINMQGVHFVATADYSGSDTILTFADVLILYKHKYNGSNQVILNVTYGNTNLTSLSGTDIPVVLKTFNLPIKIKQSKGGYLPVGTLTFVETK